MKWFKHQSTASNDDKISLLEAEFGHTGYAVYFKMVELCASNWDEVSPPDFIFSRKKIHSVLNLKLVQTNRVLLACSTLNLFEIELGEFSIRINFPKMLEIKKRYQKNNVAETTQSRAYQEKEKEKEKEEEEKKPHRPLELLDCLPELKEVSNLLEGVTYQAQTCWLQVLNYPKDWLVEQIRQCHVALTGKAPKSTITAFYNNYLQIAWNRDRDSLIQKQKDKMAKEKEQLEINKLDAEIARVREEMMMAVQGEY